MYFCHPFLFFLSLFILFWEREREREREKGRETGEYQAGSAPSVKSGMQGWTQEPGVHDLSQNQQLDAQPTESLRRPPFSAFYSFFLILSHIYNFYLLEGQIDTIFFIIIERFPDSKFHILKK